MKILRFTVTGIGFWLEDSKGGGGVNQNWFLVDRSWVQYVFLQFSTVEKLVTHLSLEHEKSEFRFENHHFETKDEFEAWKSKLEDKSMVNFVRSSSAKNSERMFRILNLLTIQCTECRCRFSWLLGGGGGEERT